MLHMEGVGTISSCWQIKGFSLFSGACRHTSITAARWIPGDLVFQDRSDRPCCPQPPNLPLSPLLISLWVIFSVSSKNYPNLGITDGKRRLLRCSLGSPLLLQRPSVGVSSSSFPVPAGSRVLWNLVFSPGRDAAPWLQVSVDWFNFLGRAEAAGLSSLHFLTPFTQLRRPHFLCYTKNSSERKGGVAIGGYWFFCVKINSLRQQTSIKRPAVHLRLGSVHAHASSQAA